MGPEEGVGIRVGWGGVGGVRLINLGTVMLTWSVGEGTQLTPSRLSIGLIQPQSVKGFPCAVVIWRMWGGVICGVFKEVDSVIGCSGSRPPIQVGAFIHLGVSE